MARQKETADVLSGWQNYMICWAPWAMDGINVKFHLWLFVTSMRHCFPVTPIWLPWSSLCMARCTSSLGLWIVMPVAHSTLLAFLESLTPHGSYDIAVSGYINIIHGVHDYCFIALGVQGELAEYSLHYVFNVLFRGNSWAFSAESYGRLRRGSRLFPIGKSGSSAVAYGADFVSNLFW